MRYRNELKFIISAKTAQLVMSRVKAIMKPDENADDTGVYVVNNIYLDDQYDTFYNEKQIGSYNRDKYRIRFYNNDLSFICLERKHKDGYLAYKEKVVMTQDELRAVRVCDFSFADPSKHPLWQKIAAIHNTRRLRPAAAFSYTRQAFVYQPGDVRITFDSAIRAEALTPMSNADMPLGINPLLEVKYTGFMPALISDMLHGLPFTRTELSKYAYIRDYTRNKPLSFAN